MEIKQYEIYWVNLDPTIGKEMKKTRPCLIISPNEMNDAIATVIIAPLTTTMRNYPSRVKCIINGKMGMIALDQLKTIDKKRIINMVGKIDLITIRQVKLVIESMLVK
jgi:mRNA interferase MazF